MAIATTSADAVERAKTDLDEQGLCVIPDVLSVDELATARAAIYQAAADDERTGNRVTGFALDSDDKNIRVWNLLTRHKLFSYLVEHPIALELVKHVLGWPALLSNISGNITQPGSTVGAVHADQIFAPTPWPKQPQGLIVAWCLDDCTVDNGATMLAPESHLENRNPTADDMHRLEAIPASAGSLLAFESRVWHRTGANTSEDSRRALVLPFYMKPIYRTQENWFLTIPDQLIANASDDLLTLLGYKTTGLGLVHGRSPR
jgi:ectoine hydroxylase-related dioxygenase (phytanoyl-CoA dioxygenase family)